MLILHKHWTESSQLWLRLIACMKRREVPTSYYTMLLPYSVLPLFRAYFKWISTQPGHTLDSTVHEEIKALIHCMHQEEETIVLEYMKSRPNQMVLANLSRDQSPKEPRNF
jgi:hypothetical protein